MIVIDGLQEKTLMRKMRVRKMKLPKPKVPKQATTIRIGWTCGNN
jgi:hypothetical protein